MKKLGMISICVFVLYAFAATDASSKNEFKVLEIAPLALVNQIEFSQPDGLPKWTRVEADYEPNDDPGDPDWNGDLGALDAGVNVLTGEISSTGYSGGSYTGDVDFFRYDLPAGAVSGQISLEVSFNPDCDNDQIYNVWVQAEDTEGKVWTLDVNFPYPHIDLVTCPFETSLLIDSSEWTDYYVFLGGVDGPATNYTISFEWSECVDLDGDGYASHECGGYDCDDTNPATYPGAEEICDLKDNDCNGLVDDNDTDLDSDGYPICQDCDDLNPNINPGSPEIPGNGVDDDCDGLTDEPDCFVRVVM